MTSSTIYAVMNESSDEVESLRVYREPQRLAINVARTRARTKSAAEETLGEVVIRDQARHETLKYKVAWIPLEAPTDDTTHKVHVFKVFKNGRCRLQQFLDTRWTPPGVEEDAL